MFDITILPAPVPQALVSGAARFMCSKVEGYVLGKLPFDCGFAKCTQPPLRA
jgi:hypothetical protein